MTVIAAAPEFAILAENPLGEKLHSTPALTRGAIFVRTEKSLFRIGPK